MLVELLLSHSTSLVESNDVQYFNKPTPFVWWKKLNVDWNVLGEIIPKAEQVRIWRKRGKKVISL